MRLWLEKIEAHRWRTGKKLSFQPWQTPIRKAVQPPFDLLNHTQNTQARLKRQNCSLPKGTRCSHTTTKFKRKRIPTGSPSQQDLSRFLLTFRFSHHISPPFLSQPFHGERKALFLWRFRTRNSLALWSQWKKKRPTTLSSPHTRPSFLGREGPLPYGSSMPLARASNPQERALPLYMTNPALWLQWPGTLCCAHPLHCHKRWHLPNTGCSKSDLLDTHISTCFPSGDRLPLDPTS